MEAARGHYPQPGEDMDGAVTAGMRSSVRGVRRHTWTATTLGKIDVSRALTPHELLDRIYTNRMEQHCRSEARSGMA